MPLLSYDLLNEQASCWVLLIHGIMGSKQNLMGFAKQLLEAFPSYGIFLVDLRGHGESKGFEGPHTLEACAGDLSQLFSHLGLFPNRIVAHSFGGKVALEYAKQTHFDGNIYILDTIPFKEPQLDPQVQLLLQVLSSFIQEGFPFSNRQQFRQALEEKGLDKMIAQWMTTNLKQNHVSYELKFDFKIIQELLESYIVADFEAFLVAQTQAQVQFLIAQNNHRWDKGHFKHLKNLENKHVKCEVLPHCGHFLHVECKDTVVGLIKQIENSLDQEA